MENILYAKIKIVRVKAEEDYKNGIPIAYHTGYITRVGGGPGFRYADVYTKTHNKPRLIRMYHNMQENKYMYYDNDNNTKLYLKKCIEFDMSLEKFQDAVGVSGIQYEIDKIAKQEEIEHFVFLANAHDNHYFGLIEDNYKDFSNDEDKDYHKEYLLNRLYHILLLYAKYDGFHHNSSNPLFRINNMNLDFSTVEQLLPKMTEADIDEINKLLDEKRQYIQKQEYEKAADIRDQERNLYIRLRSRV